MGIKAYFFDTYAFVETINNNPNYLEISDALVITTKMNLMELYYIFLREGKPGLAEFYFNKFSEFTVIISDETIKEANKFRFNNKIKKFSYIDCLGYILAMRSGVKFLTGDNAFKGMPNVEFIK